MEGRSAPGVLDQLASAVVAARPVSRLFLGALRHGHRTRAALKPFLRKAPKPAIEANFTRCRLSNYTTQRRKNTKNNTPRRSTGSKRKPPQTESALIQCGPSKTSPRLAEIEHDPANLAIKHSHPEWLVKHWTAAFGPENCEALLRMESTNPRHLHA
jgi:hypothetical protein